MTPQSPNEYVAALKQKGAEDQTVVAILRNAGWAEKEAVSALAAHYEVLAGLAAPARPRSAGGPREAFFHLLSFLTLGTWCIASGTLWFTLIHLWFPDPVTQAYGNPMAGMSWNLASVLVAFPVFLFVMRTVWRELVAQPTQADSAIRRWLTYLALLVAAGTVIGDLVTFVGYLLNGEISVRFIAKVVVVLLLAGGVFWFYLRSLQPGDEGRGARLRRHGRVGAMAAAGWVVLTLGLAFARFGSPATQRLAASDDRRSEDLGAIAVMIQNRWKAASVRGEAPALPSSLKEWPESASLRLGDPISGQPYGYSVVGGARYQLCAEFRSDTTQLPTPQRRSRFRAHPAGNYCFVIDAPAGPR